MFPFSLVNIASGDALGLVMYARRNWRPGEVIAPGTLRVVEVIEATAAGLLPLLLVEPVDGPASSS